MNKKGKKEQSIGLNDAGTRVVISRVMMGLLAMFGVVGNAISNMETNDGLYIATYSYIYKDNSYTVQQDYAITKPTKVGTEQTIYVNPDIPRMAVIESFDENALLFVIGAMMLVIPLALYMIDPDSQKDDKNGLLKASSVIFFGLLFYIVTGLLVENLLPHVIWRFSPLLVIMPLVFILMGTYSIVKIKMFEKEAEELKKHKFRRLFKVKKK